MASALVAAMAFLSSCGGRSLVGLGPADAGADAAPDVADAASGDGGDATSAPKKTCMLGVSPVTKSSLCGAHPEVCGVACGVLCADLATDSENCGGCGIACKPSAACNAGVCGDEPIRLVAPAPGCSSLRLVHENGSITWTDLGHGTIKRVSATGGVATTLASSVVPAVIHLTDDQPLLVNDLPVPAAFVVRDGVVYWINAPDLVTVDAAGFAHGGRGTEIRSVIAGGAPKTLLPAALAPDASPISSVGTPSRPAIETAGQKPPISALTLSPDGATLYFGAGSRLYSIPSAGATTAADVKMVGFTIGPEHGFATALATDGKRLFFPSSDNRGINMFDLTKPCDPSTSVQYSCPSFVYGSFPIPLLDTITVSGGVLSWSKENNVWRADLSTADPSMNGHQIYSDTIKNFGVTGFAVGPTHAYFGENTLIERGGPVSVDVGTPPVAQVIARAQPWPTSFAVDGTRVYWTTTNCDISYLVDSPQ
ncbi:MAG: putative serine/threonine-protein kinase pknH [Myxococcales bacterium]|nr:putative serine/threonine-protein kinase pknH [Myxococcales bacterium]